MEFEKDARKTGITNLIVGAVVLAGAGALQYFFLGNPEVSVILRVVLWLVAGLVGLIFCWQGISLIRSGGTWKIRIDEEGVSWESPNESVDRSFDLKLSEIDRIETRIRRKKSGQTSSIRKYVLVTNSGQEQKLSPNSGINLVQVVTTLERLGVKSETIRLR